MTKTMVAVPCMNTVDTDFFISMLGLARVPTTDFSFSKSSLVYDARNILAKRALDDGFDRILFVDSDMKFNPDLLQRLSADMDQGLEYVSSLCFTRRFPMQSVIYRELKYEDNGSVLNVSIKPFEDYPRDQIFECEGSGFGAVLISMTAIQKVIDRFGLLFTPLIGLGEDVTFCHRFKECGGKMYCDSRVKVGHIGQMVFDEETYLSSRR